MGDPEDIKKEDDAISPNPEAGGAPGHGKPTEPMPVDTPQPEAELKDPEEENPKSA